MQDASAYVAKITSGHPSPRGAEWIHQLLGVLSHAQLEVDTNPDPQTAISAYVNHGRWIAECPDCKGAQLACRNDRRFLCNECGNVAVGNLWRTVIWPDNVAGIESMLESRPRVNQNWEPGETGAQVGMDNLLNMGKIA